MERLYTVSQVAKLYEITTHTLRHYDKKGLFKPEIRDEENGYRYYTPTQFRKLEIIIHLRNLNFSIESIIEHLEKLDYNYTHNIIEKKIEENRKEINNLLKIEKKLQEEKRYFRELMTAEEKINSPFIKKAPKRKGVYVDIKNKHRESLFEGFRKLEELLGKGWKTERTFGVAVDKKNISTYGFQNSKLVAFSTCNTRNKYIQKEGLYAQMYTLRNPNKISPQEEKHYKFFFEWIKKEGYEVDGDLFIQLVVGPGRAKDEESLLDKLMVAVKKQNS